MAKNLYYRYERKAKRGVNTKLSSILAPEELSALGPINEPVYIAVRTSFDKK